MSSGVRTNVAKPVGVTVARSITKKSSKLEKTTPTSSEESAPATPEASATTTAQPSAEVVTASRAQTAAEERAVAARVQADFDSSAAPSGTTTAGYVADGDIPQLESSTIVEARELYREWEDPDVLAEQLEAQPDLSEYSELELQTLAALSIDQPDAHRALQASVVATIDEAEELDDLPNDPAFQFLYERHVGSWPEDRTVDVSRANVRIAGFVDAEVESALERNLGGAEGDGEVDSALEDFTDDVIDRAYEWPVLAEAFDDAFIEVLGESAGDITDARRADDGWLSRFNHTVTGGVRNVGGAIADELVPELPSTAGPVFGAGPISDVLNSDYGRATREVGIGVGDSIRGTILGTTELIADPVGSAKAIVEVVRNPSLLLEGYRQLAQESGPNALVGAIGFDALSIIAGAAAAPPSIGARALATAGRLRRLARFLPDFAGGSADLRTARRLRRSDAYQNLPEGIQDHALAHVNRLDTFDEAGARVVERLATDDGFANLTQIDQEALLKLSGSADPFFGTPARAQLNMLLDSADYRRLAPEQRGQRLEALLDQNTYGATFAPPDGTYRPLVDFDVAPVNRFVDDFASGDDIAGTRYAVEVDGRSIAVDIPDDLPGGRTIDQIAASIASLPEEARRSIQRVIVEPNANPLDALNENGVQLLATADATGTIRVYPASNGGSPDAFTDVLAHEAGHTLSFAEFGGPTPSPLAGPGELVNTYDSPEWQRWGVAARSDGFSSSAYSLTDIGEDFAETYRLYVNTQGTPWAFELRNLMPERFAILDELTQGAS